jgi:hypothetical protein
MVDPVIPAEAFPQSLLLAEHDLPRKQLHQDFRLKEMVVCEECSLMS